MTRLPEHEPLPAADVAPEPDPEFEPLLQRPLRKTSIPVSASLTNGVAVGRVVSVEHGEIKVCIPGFYEDELTARTLCVLPDDWHDRECAVLFENGDPARPLIVGLMLTPESPKPDSLMAPLHDEGRHTDVRVDGERLVIHADTELELRCGESVILLQRDGRIEIRGNYITSQATATQRLRGGSIHMN